jgi:hypothetical protein
MGPTREEPWTARLVREIPDAGNAPPVLFRVSADGRLRPLGLRMDGQDRPAAESVPSQIKILSNPPPHHMVAVASTNYVQSNMGTTNSWPSQGPARSICNRIRCCAESTALYHFRATVSRRID